MLEEVWKDIEGYEGLYQVSNLGNVKSINYGNNGYSKNLVPKVNNCGRLWVELAKNGVKKSMLIHRLVALAFIPNNDNLPQINHIDENPKNNRVENLEWCTLKYNLMYTYKRHPEKYCNVTDDNFGTNNYHFNHPNAKKYRTVKKLAIEQIAMDGTVIKQWENARAICVQTGMSDWSISECCRGRRKTAYGFRWQYAI